MAGVKACWQNEEAFRQEMFLALIATPIAFWLGDNNIERVLLIGCMLLVLVTELLNSALEAIVDRIGEEHHELSGRAKDMGSAAVFFTLVWTVVVWIMVLI